MHPDYQSDRLEWSGESNKFIGNDSQKSFCMKLRNDIVGIRLGLENLSIALNSDLELSNIASIGPQGIEPLLLEEIRALEHIEGTLERLTSKVSETTRTATESKADQAPESNRAKTALKAIIGPDLEEELLVFYEEPKVRAFHEDSSMEHQIDWADLFFDLTYVAAAQQLGHLLKEDVSWLGLFYFSTIFLCMSDAWRFKTYHDSTFYAKDLTHKMADVLYVCSVATSALFIQPIEEMKRMGTGYATGLSISLAVNTTILGFEKLEIYLLSKDQKAREYCGLELITMVAPRLIMYAAASTISAIELYKNNEHETRTENDFLYVTLLLLGGNLLGTLLPIIGPWLNAFPVLTSLIPWHYEHIAERYGAWIMLMLGESVLGLILTPVQDNLVFYISFIVALLTVQLIQLNHFASEEFEPSKHALARSTTGANLWIELMSLFSLSLVVFGVGLQLLLKNAVCDVNYSSQKMHGRRRLLSQHEGCAVVPRSSALLLCGAFLAQYVLQQFIIPQHEGWHTYLGHFVDPEKVPCGLFLLIGVKLATVFATVILDVFSGNMSSLEMLASIAAIATAQCLTQAVENMFVHLGKKQK
eukprot:CAMPEP_0172599800 /NCGR_PEP_ID=MMETSP1068-20121228/19920_1 /TAXON_ID=35684 /ORGANISM="Pseudopedinella elastica, Strain CCMP716" /LENGTH=587 /DNA_ID=CAMNT_0013400175 /DNA_START=240 /DNA_END=2003 /DNA_ORIENTATION=+